MKKFFVNLKKYFKYSMYSAKAELKSEVAGSYLNWLWWIIEPFCFMLIYIFVFGYIFKNSELYFASFVFIGLTVWQFFYRMISGSVKLIVNNRDLVTKIYIPKYILLLSKSFKYFFKMVISLAIVFVIMFFQGVSIKWFIIFIIPIIFVLYIVSFGFSLILMNYGVTISDLGNVTNIVLRMMLYVSGIFYNIRTKLSGSIAYLMLRSNPVAFCIDELRKVLLEGRLPSFSGLLFWLFMGILLCIIGINIIHKNENSYVKVI